MCIRDSVHPVHRCGDRVVGRELQRVEHAHDLVDVASGRRGIGQRELDPVSYTHLQPSFDEDVDVEVDFNDYEEIVLSALDDPATR